MEKYGLKNTTNFSRTVKDQNKCLEEFRKNASPLRKCRKQQNIQTISMKFAILSQIVSKQELQSIQRL